MRINVLPYAVCAFLLPLACAQPPDFAPVSAPPPPPADERLTLSAPQQEYLLGEPVVLDLTFRNTSKETITVVQAVVSPAHYEAQLWIARRGEQFQQFPRNGSDVNRERQQFSLRPGDTLHYKYRVVVGRLPELKMGFPAPGEYRVYAVYPLWFQSAERTQDIASNAVTLRVTEPMGEDARVWQQLNEPSFLTMLQLDNMSSHDVPMKLAKVLRSHPASGYAVALRHALSKIYFHRRLDLAEKDQELLAQSLDITNVESIADERLEALRKDRVVEKETSLDLVLTSLSKSGIPFDAAPELRTKKVTLRDSSGSLRQCMRSLSDDLEASWERRGNGYYLVPFDAAATQRRKGKNGD